MGLPWRVHKCTKGHLTNFGPLMSKCQKWLKIRLAELTESAKFWSHTVYYWWVSFLWLILTALFPITAKAGSQGGQGGHNSSAKNDFKTWNVFLCVSIDTITIITVRVAFIIPKKANMKFWYYLWTHQNEGKMTKPTQLN